MNASDQKSETCTSESGCATSVDKETKETSSTKKKQSAASKNKDSKNRGSSNKGVVAIPTTIATPTESKGPWTYSENCTFLNGLYQYGKDWKQIAALVKSRNAEQIQRHFHSYRQLEPFLITLRRMLDDCTLDHIIAWLPGGRSFRIYNKLTCMRIAVLLYKGDSFSFDHFQRELYAHGFEQNPYNGGYGAWFRSDFWRSPSLEIKQRGSKKYVCDYQFCKRTGNLMQCAGCRNVRYCCLACQNADWPFHMWVCGKDMSGNDKPSSTMPRARARANLKKFRKKSNQRKAKAITTSKSKIALKKETRKNTGSVEDSEGIMKKSRRSWSTEEHDRFLEGLEKYGRSWKDVASHVKTRTRVQVYSYGYHYLKNIDCYWTTKEHRRFLEGLQQYGRGHWVEIASHVGTKNNNQVYFHAEEYFRKEELNEESQKMTDNSDENSLVVTASLNKPNHNLINITSRNAKRSIDQAGDSTSTSTISKKRITKESIKQKNEEQRIVTPGKDTGPEGGMQNITDSNNSLLQESNELRDEPKLLSSSNTDSDMRNIGNWTDEEHLLFLEGLELYGKGKWQKIASHISTRTHYQVRYHAEEYFAKTQITKTGMWKDEEHRLFNEGLGLYGQGEWKKIASHVRTRTRTQVRNHFIRTGNMTGETRSSQSEDMVSYDAHQDVEDMTEKEEVINNKKSSVSNDIATPDDIDDTSCPICLEKLNDPHIVPECCHRFCKGCIEEALEYRRECPICRGRVTSRRALRRDEVFGKLLRLLDVERAKANTNGAYAVANNNVDEISNNVVAAADCQKKVREKNETIHGNNASTIGDKNIQELSNDAVATDHQTKDGEKNETTNTTEMTQEACIQEKEQTQVQAEEEQIVRNVNIKVKAQGDAIEDQLKLDSRPSENLETQLEEKSNRINTLEDSIRTLSARGRAVSEQLREKNERIQHLESRQKADKESLEHATKAIEKLETELKEKNTKIYALEKCRTISDGNKLESLAAAAKDLQSQLQEKNQRIKDLESRPPANEKSHGDVTTQASSHLETQLEEKNSRIKFLENLVRTVSDEHKVESMAASEQLQGKNDRIQHLESRQKADEAKLQSFNMASEKLETQLEEKNSRISTLQNLVRTLHDSMAATSLLREKNDKIQHLESRQKEDEDELQDVSKANEQLETELEEKNTNISSLENLVQTLTDMKKLESMDSAVNDLRSQLEDENDRIQILESRQKSDEEKLQHYCKTSNHLQTQLEEQNTKIQTLENSVRNLSEIKKLESMVAAASDPQTQLQEKIERIQFLESRQENAEEKLRQMTEFVLCLSKKLEEGK